MNTLEDFALICKLNDKKKFVEIIEKNGIDHRMISCCYDKPEFISILLDHGISLHEDVTWTCGILDYPDSVRTICEARPEMMQQLAEHHGLVARCKNPVTLHAMFKAGGVNADTKFLRPGMVTTDEHYPSYYADSVELLSLFVHQNCMDLNYTAIVNSPNMLRYMIDQINKHHGSHYKKPIQDAADKSKVVECIELLFDECFELDHEQVMKMTNPRLIELISPELRSKHPTVVEKENARRAYYDAASENDYEAMKKISDPRADVNYINHELHNTVMGVAIKKGRNLDIVKLLIERKADPNTLEFMKSYPKASTPLMCAVAENDIQIANYLLEHGADILQRDNDGDDIIAYLRSLYTSHQIMRDFITKHYMDALARH